MHILQTEATKQAAWHFGNIFYIGTRCFAHNHHGCRSEYQAAKAAVAAGTGAHHERRRTQTQDDDDAFPDGEQEGIGCVCFLLGWLVLAECVGGRLQLLLRAQAAVLSGAVGGGGRRRPNRDTQISIPGVVLLLMWSGRGCCCNTTGRGVARVHDDVPRVVDSGTLHTTTQRMLMVGSGAGGGGLCRLTDWMPAWPVFSWCAVWVLFRVDYDVCLRCSPPNTLIVVGVERNSYEFHSQNHQYAEKKTPLGVSLPLKNCILLRLPRKSQLDTWLASLGG